MKRLELLFLTKVVFILICSVIFTGISANAQPTDPNFRPKIRTGSGKKTSSKPAVQIRYITKYETPAVRTKVVQPTNLSIITVPDADITIESVTPRLNIKKTIKADVTGKVTFEDIKAGRYKLLSSLEGYQSEESETTIKPNKTAIIHIPLKQLTYDFPITTNVDVGEVRYAPLKTIEQSDGTKKLVPAGGYCVVPIENKQAVITKLSEGDYTLDVSSPDSPEYEPQYVRIQIPESIPEMKDGNSTEIPPTEIVLPNRQSTGTFSLGPNRADWMLSTENWKIDAKGLLKAAGAGIALPEASNFRFYKDFEMQSTVRLLNDTSIGFVVRAEDVKNYYLIQLTGSRDENKYLVTASIVKDGKVTERILSNPIKFLLEDVLSNHKSFDVVIKARGNTFQILAEDGTGEFKNLGNADFKDNNFPIGAVGIIGGDKSSFEVGRFTVCSEICK